MDGWIISVQAMPRLVKERDQLKEELLRTREEVAQARELAHRAREERNEAKEAEERMRAERDKTREECRRSKEDKERLESKVALLQERCDHLGCRVRYSTPTQPGSPDDTLKIRREGFEFGHRKTVYIFIFIYYGDF